MFGRNLDNTRFYSLLKNAEFAAQASPTIFDIEPDTGSSGTTTVKWNGKNYIPKFSDGSSGNAGTYNATQTANWLRTVLAKTKGHGVKFESLSPDDEALNEIEEEDDSNGEDTNGDDSNGDGAIKGCTDSTATNYDATATEDDGSCEFEEDEEEEDNTLLYGGIGVGVLALILLTRK